MKNASEMGRFLFMSIIRTPVIRIHIANFSGFFGFEMNREKIITLGQTNTTTNHDTIKI